MNDNCYICPERDECSVAIDCGSIMCQVKRMQSGTTKGDVAKKETRPTTCSKCGQPLRVIGQERFCNNVQCVERYKPK